MVFIMVVIGGVTRLTGSGLSMTDWHPLHVLPPLNEMQWQEEFNAYRQSPEYRLVNKGMELEDFKRIYYVEFIHRHAGRLTGCVFLLPFFYFLWKRKIRGTEALALLGMGALIGVQGVIGWYMVKSGLVDDPDVSPYRLTLHLSFAFLIFGLFLWKALVYYYGIGEHGKKQYLALRTLFNILLLSIFIQTAIGGMVAGTNAGLIHNTFPTMSGEWIPSGLWHMSPWYQNVLENRTTIQFLHRVTALAILILSAAGLFGLWKNKTAWGTCKKPAIAYFALLLLQITLGIKTVIFQVPLVLGSLHQAAALLLLGSLLYVIFCLRHDKAPG